MILFIILTVNDNDNDNDNDIIIIIIIIIIIHLYSAKYHLVCSNAHYDNDNGNDTRFIKHKCSNECECAQALHAIYHVLMLYIM